MNPTEPKLQTPLTDAAEYEACQWYQVLYPLVGGRKKPVYATFARSLEIKLQEAERQRDEARANYALAHSNLGNEVFENGKLQAERDQLIKVVEKFHEAHEACTFQDSEELQSEALDAYSLLPHVQARK